MPRLPDRPASLKDDMPVYLYVAGQSFVHTLKACLIVS